MLKFLRNKKNQKRIYIALAVAIIPGFMFWGISLSGKEGKTSSTLGVIEKEKISVKNYLDSYKALQHEIALMYGDKASLILPHINMKGEAWDRLLLLHYAKKEKIKTSDSEVVQWLMSQTAFMNKGRFDSKFYELYIRNLLRIDPRAFEEETRQTLTLDKIREKIKSKISIQDETLKALYGQENGERSIAYAALPWESEKDHVQTTDEELEKVYPLIKDQFKKEDRTLSFEEAKEELKALLIKQKAMNAAIKKLNEMREKIKTSSFEKVMTEEKIEIKTLEKYTKETPLPDIGIVENFQKTVAELKEGEISQGFAVTNAGVMVKVVQDSPVDDKKFEADKENFRKKTLEKQFVKEMDLLLNNLRNQLTLDLEMMKKLFPSEEL